MDSPSQIRQCTKQGCRTLTRPSAYSAVDYPGTLPRLGGGLCVICHHAENPQNCKTCEHPLRSSILPIQYAPGTRMRRKGGVCEACAHAVKKPEKYVEPESTVTPERLEQTKRGLESFLNRRRERLERFAS